MIINKTLNSQSKALYKKRGYFFSFVSLVLTKTVIGKGNLPVLFLYTQIILLSNFI